MTAANPVSRGSNLADRLNQGIREARSAPLPGARPLPVIEGVTTQGVCQTPLENIRVQVTDILVASDQVFCYGDDVVMEIDVVDGIDKKLVPLRNGSRVEAGAEKWLANLFVCEHKAVQFAPPKSFVDMVLRAEPTINALPTMKVYARRSVFDAGFVLRGPGWHSESGILVHGADIDPAEITPDDQQLAALDRLPHHLRTLLHGFCFRTDADLVNTVAVLLTGLLGNHFVSREKAVALTDGNQPGLGKTWLMRVIGIVVDGIDPHPIHFTADEEELQKRICATLRAGTQSLVLIDNAKVRGGGVISSPTIEANSMAPVISLRILGRSENYTRPNDVLWTLTMNDTRVSPDLMSRGLPIQLFHEGKPEDRTFTGPRPLDYAREHRLEILGELAGMVIHWNQQGRPQGSQSHRCDAWAQMIGGLLDVVGLPEFLGNYGDAAASFNCQLDQLAALAEAAINVGEPYITQLRQ